MPLDFVDTSRHNENMTTTTETPGTAADRYDFSKLDAETQGDIFRRVIRLYDGSRTRGRCWKIAMAEYRLSQPRPYILDCRTPGRVECSCGWDVVSYSERGLTTSARAHSRYHSKQYHADKALVAEEEAR